MSTLVVAPLIPNKPLWIPPSYRPISLLFVLFKIFTGLIYACSEPIRVLKPGSRFQEFLGICDFFHFPFPGFPNKIPENTSMVSNMSPIWKYYIKYFILYFTNKKGSGVDPASKFGGGQFQQYLEVKSYYQFTTPRDMKYTSQHCCDKTIDVKIALYHECCFPNCTNSWWKKLLL